MKNGNNSSSRGLYYNTGNGPVMQPVDIGHPKYVGLLDPDTAFWSLVRKNKLGDALVQSSLMREYQKKRSAFAQEMKTLRFGLKTSAVYFNLTDRCNLNCDYCYIPEKMRKDGRYMSERRLIESLAILKRHFKNILPKGVMPQIIFHGAEPMLNSEVLFAGIEKFKNDFLFGVQTNGTLMDDEALEFLTSREIGIGLSLDGHIARVADITRRTWAGKGVFKKVMNVLERLKGYHNYNVICTVTKKNMRSLTNIVNFFHSMKVPVCMLNPVRCTRQGGLDTKPMDHHMAKHYFQALDRTYELYKRTGHKLVTANFANVLISIVAPAARRLMCDISPCGGGRCFFAVSANGDIFPCSEFIGIKAFKGGNIFRSEIKKALNSSAFRLVTGRKVEDIKPCSNCAVRHFCGSPCPAEAYEMNGGMDKPGAFCEFYEEQVRYALRVIADSREDAYLWDNWDSETAMMIKIDSL